MATRLLDTDICIEVLRGAPGAVQRMAAEMAGGELRVSAVTAFELVYGAEKSGRAEERWKVRRFIGGGPSVTPFDEDDAQAAGTIRADLARRGEMIGAYDLLIAAQGLARDWVVVT